MYGRHGDLSEPGALDRCIGATLATPGVQALHLDRDAVVTRMAERPPTYANLFDVIHRLHAEALGKARWCDQLGLVEAYADPIFDAFPSARFIHMVGDPPGTAPTKRTPGASGWAVGKWLTSMELAERNARRYGDRYLVVRHEDLLADEETTLRDVCAFLGEELEPSMLVASPPPQPQPADPARQRFVERTADRIGAHGVAPGRHQGDRQADRRGDVMENPVFVAGLERSGTSLMYALLASHPNISMTRRTNFWRYFVDQYGDLGRDDNLDACLESMRTYKRLVVLELDFERLRRELIEGPRTYGRLYVLLQAQVAERRGKQRWGDKSLNIERYTDRLLADFPDARILHMIRDPRDRLASVLARWRVRRGASARGSRGLALVGPSRAQHVPPDPTTTRSSDTSGWSRRRRWPCVRSASSSASHTPTRCSMEGPRRFRESGSNSSYGARAVGAISTDSIGKYKEVLAPRQIAFIQAAAGRVLSRGRLRAGPRGDEHRRAAALRRRRPAVSPGGHGGLAGPRRRQHAGLRQIPRPRLPDRRGPSVSNSVDGPVFICGAERSGTSLMYASCRVRTRSSR